MNTTACFVDFQYPRQCSSWGILDIVKRAVQTVWGSSPRVECIDSNTLARGSVFDACDIVLGVEQKFVNVFGGVAGPTYNSSGVGALLTSTLSRPQVTGWEFLEPFSWGVWLVFGGCALAAFGSQLLMRWLDFRRKKTSPRYVITEDEEKAFDLVMTSFTALVNATRLYKYYQGPFFRHMASMVMAVFSVFFMSLYASNLTAFLFPSSQATLKVDSYDVHWSLFDDASLLIPRGSSAIVSKSAKNATLPIVAPDVWLDCASGGAFVKLGGAVTYPVVYATRYEPKYTTSASVVDQLANETWPASGCTTTGGTTTRLSFQNVWGLFACAAFGYAVALAMMAIREPKRFDWFVKKSPTVNEPDTLDTVNPSTHPNRRSLDERIDMFDVELTAGICRAYSTPNPEITNSSFCRTDPACGP